MSPRRVWALLREPRLVTAYTGAAWIVMLCIGIHAVPDTGAGCTD